MARPERYSRGIPGALLTPRISLVDTKLVICACPSVTTRRRSAAVQWCTGCGTAVGRGGVVPGVGIPGGYYPCTHPVSLIWYCQGPTNAWPTFLRPPWHSRPHCGPPHTMAPRTQYTALQANRARSQAKYPKVSHKSRVSLKVSHEACHSPYIKKTVQMSRP